MVVDGVLMWVYYVCYVVIGVFSCYVFYWLFGFLVIWYVVCCLFMFGGLVSFVIFVFF